MSSTAHLVVLPWLMKWGGMLDTLPFDVALHAGTFFAVLYCFRKDIVDMVRKNHTLMLMVILGTIPAGLAGVFLEGLVEQQFRSPKLIALMLVVFGLVMFGAERFKAQKKAEAVGFRDAFIIGLAQAVALIPGVSRSGITISAGLLCGLKREEAARFSFLLSLPVIAGATLLQGRKILHGGEQVDMALVGAGFAASLITGVFAIKFLMGFLKRHTMDVFVAYRFVLAGVIIVGLWLGK